MLIDFFHTHRGHALKDLIKLENDLLYIFTRIEGTSQLDQAMMITRELLAVEDLARPLPEIPQLTTPSLHKAWEVIRHLRSYYQGIVDSDRGPLQAFIAMLRYAVHTLSFDEASHAQRLWALYSAGMLGERINRMIRANIPLHIDWLDHEFTTPGKLGLTILPGRRDHGRDLSADIETMKRQGVNAVAVLITSDEINSYGVQGLLDTYAQAGLTTLHIPIMDQWVTTTTQMNQLIEWTRRRLGRGEVLVFHCIGGLGRSGMAAACYLKSIGVSGVEAISMIRETRSIRAVETQAQESFVESFRAP